MPNATIRSAFDTWPHYDRRFREVVENLTEEQLAIGPSPESWPLWATIGHTACQRVFWLCDFAGEPGVETTRFTNPPTTVRETTTSSTSSGQTSSRRRSNRRSASTGVWIGGHPRRSTTSSSVRDGATRGCTRAAGVIQRVFAHDVYHCAEVNDVLSGAGLPLIDLWG